MHANCPDSTLQTPKRTMKLTKTRRHQAQRPSTAALPEELRSFDNWLYPNGLHDYMAALSQSLDRTERLTPIMNAAGLSAADWFRRMLSKDPQ